MKKQIFLGAIVILVVSLAYASRKTVVVRTTISGQTKGNTEVRVSEDPAPAGSDSLVIIPGVNASYVDIKVKDFAGNTESEERITVTGTCTEQPVETQEVSDDKIVEVSDDNGFYGVY